MYVCVCNQITDKMVEDAAKATKNPTEALTKLGIGSSCGICLIDAIEKTQNHEVSPKSSPKKQIDKQVWYPKSKYLLNTIEGLSLIFYTTLN